MSQFFRELANGKRFAVGTGFTDAERCNPPPVGGAITFRYQELTDGGVPRFPTYLGIRIDAAASKPKLKPTQGNSTMTASAAPTNATRRRFEFVEGTSNKFYEVTTVGSDVTVRYGRNGTDGQTSTKSFADSAAAQKHADKLIAEKCAKGYREV